MSSPVVTWSTSELLSFSKVLDSVFRARVCIADVIGTWQYSTTCSSIGWSTITSIVGLLAVLSLCHVADALGGASDCVWC